MLSWMRPLKYTLRMQNLDESWVRIHPAVSQHPDPDHRPVGRILLKGDNITLIQQVV